MTHYSTVSKTSDVCADNKREDLFPPAENAGSRVSSAARPFRARLVGLLDLWACSILWKRRRPRIGNLWWRQKSDPCHAMALDHDVNYHVWML
ncbi:hypothetical protein PC128_g20759 [Phytophthora cactorum]|nr:hypothetical protein PC128_g20759 [Phytophthora cactorum]